MTSGWYTSANGRRTRLGHEGPTAAVAGRVIRVEQVSPGVWLPGPAGRHQITVAPSPAVTEAITGSLVRAAHLAVARARVQWAVASATAAQREVLESNGWLEPASGREDDLLRAQAEAAVMRAAPADSAAFTAGPPASAAPAGPEKQLAPGPPPDEIALIRSVICGPLGLDPAELDRLASYDTAPAGICGQCHLGAALAGSTLCWYCGTARQLAAQSPPDPARRCGDITRPAWVPGFCGCVSREMHNQARRAAGHPDCDHGGLWMRFVRDGACRRCGEYGLTAVRPGRTARAALAPAGFTFPALTAFVLCLLAIFASPASLLPALAALAVAVAAFLRGKP